MNNDNLVTLSPREARENGSKGGKASVIARRQKKLLREAMQYVLNEGELSPEIKEKLKQAGLSEEDHTHTMAMTLALIEKAEKGDVSAYNAIRDILGEKPTEEANTEIPTSIKIEMVPPPACYGDLKFASSEEEIDGERDPRYMIHRE